MKTNRIIITLICFMLGFAACAQTPSVSSKTEKQTEVLVPGYKLFPTTNMWIFLKLDTSKGLVSMVQYSMEDKNRLEIPINYIPFASGADAIPGRFNLSTVITDANGNSLDLAGDWAVFQDPDETKFTNYLHYDQTSETMFSVKENDAFMLEYDQGRESLPVYVNGIVDKRRSVFLQGATRDLIYKDGRIHTDYRDVYILYNAAYGDPDLHAIIDDNTLTFEDLPNVRLRRIKAFEK